MSIKVLAAKASEPDNDGDSRFEVSFNFTNDSLCTVEHLNVRLLVCAPDGTPLGEAEEDIEEMIGEGESGRMSISSYRIPFPLHSVTEARLTVTVVPMSCTFLDLGKIPISNQKGGITSKNDEKTENGLSCSRWSCHRRRDDRDNEVTLEASAWLDNHTGQVIHKTTIRLQIFNYSGRPLNDTESRDDRLLFSGIPTILTDSLYCKSSQLKDAYISATIRGFLPQTPESVEISDLQLDR